MKGIDLFCASEATTAIWLSMEEESFSDSNPLLLAGDGIGGSRAIDRHNPIIGDSRRTDKSHPPCTTVSQPAHENIQLKKKKHQNRIPLKGNGDPAKKKERNISVNGLPEDEKIKKRSRKVITVNNDWKAKSFSSVVQKVWSCTRPRPGDFISPSGSRRYLLGEKVLSNGVVLDFDPTRKFFPEETDSMSEPVKITPSSDLSPVPDQMVVLRVSLHCKGCERKMRKHISRMEGVKSFDIDFVEKKVTVVGKVNPLSVLSSISKVKNAQFWSPQI